MRIRTFTGPQPVLLLALTVALAGCETAAPPTAPPAAPPAAADLSVTLDAAEASGGEVVVFEDGSVLFRHHGAPDAKSGLWSFHSNFDFGTACRGGPFNFFPVGDTKILSPSDEEAKLLIQSADQIYTLITTEITPELKGDPTVICAAIAHTLVADGLTTWQLTDNDVSGTGQLANAFGHTAHGILNLAEGGQAQYSEVSRLTFEPGAPEATSEVYQISLTPLSLAATAPHSVSPSAAVRGRSGSDVAVPLRLAATFVWNVDQGAAALAACPGTPGLAVGTGEGRASHLGRFSVTTLDHCSIDLAPPVELGDILRQGQFEWAAADGSTLLGSYTFLFLPPEDGGFFDFVVDGGTGRFSGATGSLSFVDFLSPTVCDDPLCLVNAVAQAVFEGTLRLPKP